MNSSAEAKARWLFTGCLLLAVAGAGAWWLFGSWGYSTYELRTRDAVSGLIPGAPVEFHGVEVGQVRTVQLLEPRLVRVRIAVRREVPVSTATVATITGRGLATRGFTGYVYVSLEEGDATGLPLAAPDGSPYPLLASAPARQVNLDTSISELNQSVQSVNALLQGTLDPRTVASLQQSLTNLEQVTRTLSANNEKLVAIIANTERASQQVQPLLQASNGAARTLQAQVLPQAHATLRRLDALSVEMDAHVGTILRNTEQASTRIEPLLESGNEAVRSLQTQILPQAQRTLARLDHLSTSMDEAATRVRRNPALVLRGSRPAEPGPGEAQ
jgi:phospholipid/cholesterol/gamma-HCH transport system substrate-binding protein